MPGNDEYNVVALQEREGRAVKPVSLKPKNEAPAKAPFDDDIGI
jgi:hypothetical protein